MLESALYCGISIDAFWNYTIDDVKLLIEAFNKREKNKMQWEAQQTYINAMLVGRTTANILSNGKSKIPQLYEVFPNLFDKPTPQQQDWRIAKERMMNYANAHNKKRGESK